MCGLRTVFFSKRRKNRSLFADHAACKMKLFRPRLYTFEFGILWQNIWDKMLLRASHTSDQEFPACSWSLQICILHKSWRSTSMIPSPLGGTPMPCGWWLWWVPRKCWLHPQSAFSEIWVLATQSKEFPIKADWQLERHAFLLLRTSTFSSPPGRLFMLSAFHNLVTRTLCKSSFSSAQYVAVEIKIGWWQVKTCWFWLSKMVLATQLYTVYWGC